MTFMPTSDFDSDIVAVGIGRSCTATMALESMRCKCLRDSARVPAGVSRLDRGRERLGLELVSYLENAKRILLLDAV